MGSCLGLMVKNSINQKQENGQIQVQQKIDLEQETNSIQSTEIQFNNMNKSLLNQKNPQNQQVQLQNIISDNKQQDSQKQEKQKSKQEKNQNENENKNQNFQQQMDKKQIEQLKLLKDFFDSPIEEKYKKVFQKFHNKIFSGLSIHCQQDNEKNFYQPSFLKELQSYQQLQNYLQQEKIISDEQKFSKAIASFLGNAIGDALGAHTEFQNFNTQRQDIQPSWDSLIKWANKKKTVRTKFGVITDDSSMGRCIADSLLSNNGNFNPTDLRFRFILWWYTGYCNGSQNESSFGLGGNINQGFKNFFKQQCPPFVINLEKGCQLGDINGNGSIMRLGTVPIAFHDNIEKAQTVAALQSLTTHNGYEASECCRLLTYLAVKLMNYEGQNPKQDIFDKELQNFQTNCPSVKALANSQQEENLDLYDQRFNFTLQDRYWNWKNQELKPSPTRLSQQQGYFGSYCMDGAYVALHISYHSKNQSDAIFQAVNWGGDSDSIAAVVGYITGAMYGMDEQIWQLYTEKMVQHDDYTQLIKGIRLFNKDYINDKNSIKYQDPKFQESPDFYIEFFQKIFQNQDILNDSSELQEKQEEQFPIQTPQKSIIKQQDINLNSIKNKDKFNMRRQEHL
ncbi:ADP-ribosylation/Crystallin J1 [Pseudocohnilembus persalinus]|uniref:ADP-ribosylation/Crystallin J1 n=1 Tax=Pseudocohnilembus persalinus TaxID=266149 RepID=A0A0V0QKV3_PSEPJ|nr:ADP-ribosylation/Crystallin J1 [Pseudocohnilembus persalinus]|eukprot:KRX02732.1 ADP-ribosylation/Crystallin J1 [Pseudocohnilembus persalinus]